MLILKLLKLKLLIFSSLLVILASCDRYNKLLKSTDYELNLTKAKEYYDKGSYIKSSQLYE